MKKNDKLQISFDEVGQDTYTFTREESFMIADYLTDCYLAETLPMEMGKLQLKFYMFKLNLSQDIEITLPYIEVKKLSVFFNGRILSPELNAVSLKLWNWVMINKKGE